MDLCYRKSITRSQVSVRSDCNGLAKMFSYRRRLALALVMSALDRGGDDDECLRVVTEQLESPRVEFMSHVYWDDLDV